MICVYGTVERFVDFFELLEFKSEKNCTSNDAHLLKIIILVSNNNFQSDLANFVVNILDMKV